VPWLSLKLIQSRRWFAQIAVSKFEIHLKSISFSPQVNLSRLRIVLFKRGQLGVFGQ
jgi:hypothetical protein